MTHRNTELLEVIEEVRELLQKHILVTDIETGEWIIKIKRKKLLQILDKVKEEK